MNDMTYIRDKIFPLKIFIKKKKIEKERLIIDLST